MTRTRRAGGGVVLGVDLGTCYSAAAVCLDGVDVEVLHNDIGDPTTPTCVYVDADGADRQVGEAAVRLAVSDPGRTVRNVKRILGVTLDAIRRDPWDALGSVQVVPADGLGADRAAVRLGSALDLAPEEIAGSVLLELRKAAEARVGRAVRRAVVAVPGYFNAAQRSAVRDAAALAGLEDVRLVNETSAAALAYAHGREGQGPRNVVVVDVGGGGAAVSIVEVRNDFVRVLASSGVRLPGGEDFDREMVEYLKQVVKEEHGKDVTDPRSLELLRAHWERAKRKLMQLPHTKIDTFLPGEVDVELCRLVKRAEFEERCEPLFRRVAEQLRATLHSSCADQVGVEAVHDVVLVGGSTRIPRLRALVQEVVAGRPLCKALNADEAVARGAALLGEDLVRLQDVTPLQLAALGGDPLLRNSPLPADGRMPGADSGDTVVVSPALLCWACRHRVADAEGPRRCDKAAWAGPTTPTPR
ncbi:hypothetical protein ONE63_005413 [Megalurothrips usitatus]|uniref:Uncharacterized protein n=1 Tax=Megalurothrips usitatus TaxID=439358 RepID=A0AAV7XZG5_9NEOP|nr:hypothetical protein ONE63_005413 [Megalurothrips usitatus]